MANNKIVIDLSGSGFNRGELEKTLRELEAIINKNEPKLKEMIREMEILCSSLTTAGGGFAELSNLGISSTEPIRTQLLEVSGVFNGLEKAADAARMLDSLQKLTPSFNDLGTCIGAATSGTDLLGTLFKQFPVPIAVAGISLIADAFMYLNSIETEATIEAKKQKQAIEELVSKNDALIDSMDRNAEAYEKKLSNLNADLGATDRLKDEIYELVDAVNDATEGTDEHNEKLALLHTKVNNLNDIVPDLALAFDDETGKLNLSNDALDKQIKNRRKVLELAVMQAAKTAADRENTTEKMSLNVA